MGTVYNPNAKRLQGRTVDGTAPTNGQVLTFDNQTEPGNPKWTPKTPATANAAIVVGGIGSQTVSASSTLFNTFTTNNFVSSENQRQAVMPRGGTITSFYLTTIGAQPASGAVVVTIRVNGADTLAVINIPAGSAAGTFVAANPGGANNVVFNAGDLISIKFANAATGASAPFAMWAVAII